MDRGSLSEPENRLGVLNEPPCAEPHAGWCGGWRLNTSGYPIMCRPTTQDNFHARALKIQHVVNVVSHLVGLAQNLGT